MISKVGYHYVCQYYNHHRNAKKCVTAATHCLSINCKMVKHYSTIDIYPI